jgi:hypothetical protein
MEAENSPAPVLTTEEISAVIELHATRLSRIYLDSEHDVDKTKATIARLAELSRML